MSNEQPTVDNMTPELVKNGLYTHYMPSTEREAGFLSSLHGWFVEEILYAPIKIARAAGSRIVRMNDQRESSLFMKVIVLLLTIVANILLWTASGLLEVFRQLMLMGMGLLLILRGKLSFVKIERVPEADA